MYSDLNLENYYEFLDSLTSFNRSMFAFIYTQIETISFKLEDLYDHTEHFKSKYPRENIGNKICISISYLKNKKLIIYNERNNEFVKNTFFLKHPELYDAGYNCTVYSPKQFKSNDVIWSPKIENWDRYNGPVPEIDILINSFKNEQIVSINDIRSRAKNHSIKVTSIKKLLDAFYDAGFIRINDSHLADKTGILSKQNIVFLNQINKNIIKTLETVKKTNLDNFRFDTLPKISATWNKHLLAHLIKNTSTIIEVKDVGERYNTISYILSIKE